MPLRLALCANIKTRRPNCHENVANNQQGCILRLILIIGLLSSTCATAQVESSLQHIKTTVTLANRSAAAKTLALERYKFLKRLEPKFGNMLPIGGDETYNDSVLFPVGRSDRMYVMLLPGLFGKNFYRIYCYQRNAGRDKLVYTVKLERKDRLASKDKPAKQLAKVTSLLDIITTESSVNEDGAEHVEGYAVQGKLSSSVWTDLAKKQDYVHYHYSFGINALNIWLLSDIAYDGSVNSVEGFELDKDPITNADLTGYEFYTKYGLPAASGELAIIQKAQK